jgi:hypothetical protein
MDILKAATDWAKAELVSTSFFIIIGFVFVFASFGFWQFGKTELAKAYIIPMLITGAFLLAAGVGLFFTNKGRITQFESAYNKDVSAFVQSELDRTEATLKEYKNIVFTAIPIIIAICAVIIFTMNAPVWRASAISMIAMLFVILMIDGMAHARIEVYKQRLETYQSQH